jgi:hypothetical protein
MEVIKIPKDFLDCVKNGGRVKTKNLKGDKYIRICYDKEGNSYAGEVMKKKSEKSENKEKSNALEKEQIKESKDLAASLLKLKAYYDEQYHVK